MKHFNGSRSLISKAHPDSTHLPAKTTTRRAAAAKPAPLEPVRSDLDSTSTPLQPNRRVAAAPPPAEPQRGVAPRPAASRHAASAKHPTAAPHNTAARMQQPAQHSSRRLVRVASHSIEVASSDLSGTDSEPEGVTGVVGPSHTPTSSSHRLRQRKQTDSSQQSAAAAAAGAESRASSSTQQRRRARLTAAAAAAGAGGGSAAPPPSSSSSSKPRQQQRHWWSHAKPALSAAACIVLLVACGSTLRAATSWHSGSTSDSSSSSSRRPSFAAAGGADAAAAAAGGAAGGDGFTGSSWLSAVPLLGGARSAEVGGAAAAARSPSWLASSSARLAGGLRSTAQHAASLLGASRAAAVSVRSTAAHASSTTPAGPSSSRTATIAAAASTGAAATVPPGGSSSSGSSSRGSNAGTAGSIKMYAVVDASAPSPFVSHSPKGSTGLDWSANWGQVVQHMAQRLAWADERFNLQVITQDELKTNAAARQALSTALSTPNPSAGSPSTTTPMFVGIGISDPEVASFLTQATAQLPTALFWNSDPALTASSRVDGYSPSTAGPFAQLLAQHVGFSREAKAAEVLKTLDILWGRNTSDDLLYIWLVLLNQYVTPVPMVANTTKGTDLASLFCMIKNCGQKIVDCVTDKTCKAGLDCLEGCAFNDQVCQYRCIVSYETPQFEQFALCILQLHNCRGLSAEIPMRPDPAPMTQWRGQPLSHETAEDLFIGWLSKGPQLPAGGEGRLKPYSWLVAAGKNPAYDAFGCQHQLYYRGKGKGQLWYEPVFRVTTLEGKEVWRDRRYRVRRGKTPGTFHYSVLDNGVTSNEYWRIIDCAEDLTYCLFYYSGAAAAAGMSYTGAVLGTRDGLWPTAYTERIHGALRQAGIEPWELSMPDNSRCADAPLKPVAA